MLRAAADAFAGAAVANVAAPADRGTGAAGVTRAAVSGPAAAARTSTGTVNATVAGARQTSSLQAWNSTIPCSVWVPLAAAASACSGSITSAALS